MKTLSYPLALGWTLAATVFVHVGAVALVGLWPPAQFDIVLLGALQVLVYAAVVRMFLAVYGESIGADPLALTTPKWSLVLLSIILGVVLQIPTTTLVELVDKIWPTSEQELAERLQRITASTVGKQLLITAVVAGFGPLIEEVFFRGALSAALLKSGTRVGTAICVAACFAIAHMDPRLWPPLFVVGLVLTYVRIASGSLWPAFALHAAFNLTTLLTIFSQGVTSPKPPSLPWPLALVGWGASIVLLFIIYKLTTEPRVGPTPKHDAGTP